VSTQINVTVGSGGLSDKARQLQTAARQAQLEKERTINLSAEALDKRVAAQAAKGLSPDGLPLYGTSFKQTEIERRPAASRVSSLPGFLLVPDQDFVADTIQAKTKSIKNKLFFCRRRNTIDIKPLFVPSGGPGNAPFLQSPQVSANTGIYLATVEFPVCDNTDVQAVIEDFREPLKVLTSNGAVTPTQIKKPLHKLKEYTAEGYIKGDGTFSPVGSVSAFVDLSIEHFNFGPPSSGANLFYAGLQYNENISSFLSFNYRLDVSGLDGLYITIFFGSYSDSYPLPSDSYIWPESLQANKWYHVALVKTETSQSIYFEGTLIYSALSDFSELLNLPDTAIFKAYAGLANGGERVLQPGVGGFRFTPKALYAEPFTPPASITSLA
jgi:hypothetical protein